MDRDVKDVLKLALGAIFIGGFRACRHMVFGPLFPILLLVVFVVILKMTGV